MRICFYAYFFTLTHFPSWHITHFIFTCLNSSNRRLKGTYQRESLPSSPFSFILPCITATKGSSLPKKTNCQESVGAEITNGASSSLSKLTILPFSKLNLKV